MTTLGSGKYKIEVAPAGVNGQRLPPIADVSRGLERLRWNRKLDAISSAIAEFVVVPDCFDDLCTVRTVWHELRVRRDGHIVWEGPIVVKKTRRGSMELIAFDLSWWLQRRFIPGGVLIGQSLDLAQIVDLLVAASLSQTFSGSPMDPAFLGFFSSRNVQITANPSVAATSYRYAFDELRSWAQTELDWTVVKRAMLVGNPPVEVRLPKLTLNDFLGDPEIVESGTDYATDVVVIGGDGRTVGIASVESVLGIRVPAHLRAQVREIVQDVSDQATLQLIAEQMIRLRYPSPVEIKMGTGAALSPKAPVCIDQLIPGAIGEVDVTGFCAERTLQMSELVNLSVTVTSKGEKVATDVRPVVTV